MISIPTAGTVIHSLCVRRSIRDLVQVPVISSSNTKTKEFLPSILQEVHEWKRKGEARPKLVRWPVWIKKKLQVIQ
jgi:hypothetical protein